jgi:SAM-dependent methyltransferase
MTSSTEQHRSAGPLPIPGLVDEGTVMVTIERRADLQRLREGWDRRFEYEQRLADLHRNDERWLMPGYCAPCRSAQLLTCDWVSTWGGTPNFRERLHCPRCGLNSRQRLMTQLVETLGQPPYFLYELVTPFYRWASETLPEVVGSEYLGYGIPGGTDIDGLRHEDALNLSFADESFGTIVSADVFEHVADVDATLAECVRVLRPGGSLILSIPFDPDKDTSVRRAELRDGEPVHLLEPDYHGNPLDQEKGSLVFYNYGWDVVERMRDAGFGQAGVIAYWSHYHGYLGRGLQFAFVATR